MYNRCNNTTQEADLTEDLVVDGETFGCVKIVCYLGYTLGGADLATAALNQKWMNKVQRYFTISDIQSSPARYDRVYASCARLNIIYRSTLPS